MSNQIMTQTSSLYTVDPYRERIDILKRYRRLLTVWKPKPDKEKTDRAVIRKAFQMATEAHKDMRRKSGEPYVIHPLEVAIICVEEIGLGTTSIVSALLHDVIEDTDLYKLEDIEKIFGSRVTMIIDGLTKIKKIFDNTEPSSQAVNYRKLLETMSSDVRVILIKLADRLHNMRTLTFMRPEKQMKIAAETHYLFAPLAHRLGLYAIKSELEDLALKYTEPEVYSNISRKIDESEQVRSGFANKFLYPIRKELSEKGYSYRILIRNKSVYSIWQKMQKKNIPFDEVYDVFAIRIVVDVPLSNERTSCWEIYALVTDHYRPKPDRLRDWISIPKANGYQSLHTTVMSHSGKWVEVQIRTERMDEIAEKGYAAHYKYKGSYNDERNIDNWLDRIRDMLSRTDGDAVNFIDEFQGYLFSREIFVFTPQGELRILPADSTVLDFAYAIHTEVGDTCIGANVNHQLKPRYYVLKNGDQIEVLSSKKQEPDEEWLNHVKTARAKTKIKESLREIKKRHTEEGKLVFEGFVEQFGLEWTQESQQLLLNQMGYSSETDLYYNVYRGSFSANDLKRLIQASGKSWFSRINPFSRSKSDHTGQGRGFPFQSSGSGVLSSSATADLSQHSVATCCNPIPGDDVMGFATPDRGIIIHRSSCPEAIELMSKFGENVIKAKWTDNAKITFLAGITISSLDKKGLLFDISRIISDEMDINIKSIKFESDAGVTQGQIMIYVSNTGQLASLINKIRKLDGVQKAYRIGSYTNTD